MSTTWLCSALRTIASSALFKKNNSHLWLQPRPVRWRPLRWPEDLFFKTPISMLVRPRALLRRAVTVPPYDMKWRRSPSVLFKKAMPEPSALRIFSLRIEYIPNGLIYQGPLQTIVNACISNRSLCRIEDEVETDQIQQKPQSLHARVFRGLDPCSAARLWIGWWQVGKAGEIEGYQRKWGIGGSSFGKLFIHPTPDQFLCEAAHGWRM